MNKECKLAFAYLYEKRAAACLLALAVAFLFLITELFHAPREMAVYTSLMLGTGAALAFAVGLYRYRAVHNALQVLLRQSAVALEEMPVPRGLLDRDWQALVRAVDAARRDAVERSETARRDAQEYYTLWAHQVKTPLAAMQLLAQEEEFPAQGLFLSELFQTQQYVDMVMSYQRMASMTKDLCAQEVDVDAAVQAAVRRVQPLFAGKQQVKLEVQATGIQVVSDTKWLGLVIEQLLTNAVKYTRRGFVKVYAQVGALVVEDSGIGISPDELPRVFERGFTGLNGRASGTALALGCIFAGKLRKNWAMCCVWNRNRARARALCFAFRRFPLRWNDPHFLFCRGGPGSARHALPHKRRAGRMLTKA